MVHENFLLFFQLVFDVYTFTVTSEVKTYRLGSRSAVQDSSSRGKRSTFSHAKILKFHVIFVKTSFFLCLM